MAPIESTSCRFQHHPREDNHLPEDEYDNYFPSMISCTASSSYVTLHVTDILLTFELTK